MILAGFPSPDMIRINRYIMECKLTSFAFTHFASSGINRYIMECKSTGRSNRSCIKVELIDTLWNVNWIHIVPVLLGIIELIDTLWNVNRGTSI